LRGDDDSENDAQPVAGTPGRGVPATDSQMIDDARDAAAEFSATLPNFLVQQVTTRYSSSSTPADWHSMDVVTAEVSCVNGKEDYRNIKVNGRTPSGPVENTGSWSTGEFVLTLNDVLSPATAAFFVKRGNDRVAGRPVVVYDMSVEHPNSHWEIVDQSQHHYKPAYKGSLWIDRETRRVMRIEQQTVSMPRNFAYDHAESVIEYGFVSIDGKSYLLPVKSENLACLADSGNCVKNVIEFRNYRKFNADSKITFDKFQDGGN
jgi:hypothetical protein